MSKWRPDEDGKIRLRTKPEITEALQDPSLGMTGGWDRPGDIYGEFIYLLGKEPKLEPTIDCKPAETPAVAIKPESPQKRRRNFNA